MLQELDKEIQTFKKKNQANIHDMKNNVAKLSQITASLEAAVTEQEVRWFGVKNTALKLSVSSASVLTKYLNKSNVLS